jgi:hypothetical protein
MTIRTVLAQSSHIIGVAIRTWNTFAIYIFIRRTAAAEVAATPTTWQLIQKKKIKALRICILVLFAWRISYAGAIGRVEGEVRHTIRRRQKTRQQEAVSLVMNRLTWQVEKLDWHLARAAVAHAVMAREFAAH